METRKQKPPGRTRLGAEELRREDDLEVGREVNSAPNLWEWGGCPSARAFSPTLLASSRPALLAGIPVTT